MLADAIAPKISSARSGTQPKTAAAVSRVDQYQAPPYCHDHWRRISILGGVRRHIGMMRRPDNGSITVSQSGGLREESGGRHQLEQQRADVENATHTQKTRNIKRKT